MKRTPLHTPLKRWTCFRVVHDDLAAKAVDTFVGIDLTQRMDGLHGAARIADTAFPPALRTASQPLEEAQFSRYGQGSAQGTEIPAEEALDEQP